MSVASAQSMGSQRMGAYRTVNRATNNVDETLFGQQRKASNTNGKDIIITGKDTVQVRYKGKRSQSTGAAKGDAVVIPASELNRLKDNATLLSKAEQDELKKRAEEAYNERMKRSQIRKEKMLQMEEERKKNELLSDKDKDGRAQKNSVLER